MTHAERAILYLSPYFWPEEIGSAPYSSELAVHLAARAPVIAVTFRPHYPSIDPFGEWADGSRDRETHDGVEIQRVPVAARGAGGFKDRLRNDLRFLAQVTAGALRGRYRGTEVIVAYVPSVLTLYGAKLVAVLTGAPILAVVHDIESGLAAALGIGRGRGLLALMRFVERIGLNFAQEVVVLTDGMKTELQAIGCHRPISVIPIWGQPSASSPIDPAARPVLTYSGNFGKKQNIDQLLPLFARLTAEGRDVGIVLRGGGSELGRIQTEIAARGIQNVQFLPLVPAAEFTSTLQAANIHLVPQASNVANYALPSKLFSIMAAGRPFVCMAVKGSPLDVLATKSGAGICVPPQDDIALYAAVSALLADPASQREMGQKGQDFVRTYMNRDIILAEFSAKIAAMRQD